MPGRVRVPDHIDQSRPGAVVNALLRYHLRRLGLDPDTPPRDAATWRSLVSSIDETLDSELARGRHHYGNLFEESPIPTWEEDYTAVGAWLDQLKNSDVTDLQEYFEAHPEQLRQAIGLIEVTDVNAAALAFLGVDDKTSALGRFDVDGFNEASLRSYSAQFNAIWTGTPSISYEITGQRGSGERVDAILHWSAPFIDGELDLSKVIVAMVDITDRIRAMEEMEKLIRSKDDFLATVSHELRTPLTSVYGSAEALLDQWGELDPETALELVSFIARESGELTHLVEDLLVAARAEIGRLTFRLEEVDLQPLVRSVIEAVAPHADGGSIDASRVSGVAYADPHRLKQILRNLVTNALRYGGPEVRIESHTRNGRAAISVLDNGPGVPTHRRAAMFELYERAHDADGPVGSVGVGLAVSRQLADKMNGRLRYDHRDGWSRFDLELPSSALATSRATAFASAGH